MKRAFGVRCTSSTSSASAPPRSRITVAAWRGTVSSPGLSSSPGAGTVDLRHGVQGYRFGRMSETTTAQKWICESCGFIYDPADGDPDGGIPPGTAFDDIPDTWFCPVCGARKRDFIPYED